MKVKQANKILSLLLAAAMALTMLPLTALAATTGTMNIGGETVSDLSADAGGLSTKGWEWDAASDTLTLDSGYNSGNYIDIQCTSGDVFLVLTDDVTIDISGRPLGVWGSNLTINAGSHTLTLVSDIWEGLITGKSIVINSGTVNASSGDSMGIGSYGGDITISGSANVTATGNGLWSNGIQAAGDVIINTTGTVTASGGENCGIRAENSIQISGGTVTAKGRDYGALNAVNGITITGGTVTTDNTAGASGDVYGDLTVSGAATNVAVNGDVTGDLTVSGGMVTVNGTVSGTTTVTGGSVRVNGQLIPPTGGAGETITYPGNGTLDAYGNLTPTIDTSLSGNSVTVNGGADITGWVFGGWSTGAGNTDNNTVTINGGTMGGVFGGYSQGGNSTGNSVVINGGTIAGWVVGGYSNASPSNITSNSVTISGSPNLSGASLIGGNNGSTWQSDNNTLNFNTSGLTIYALSNFANYNFTLPSSLSNGGTILTVTAGNGWGSPIDIGGATIGISFTGAPILSVGNKIILIDETGGDGITGTPTTTSVTASGYTFALSVSGGKLVATVTAVPGGGNNDSGGGSTTQTAPAADGTVKVEYSQSGGAVTLSLPDSKLNEIIGASEDTATIDLSGVKNTTSAALPKAALDKLAGAGLDVELKLPQGTITLDEKVAASLALQASGTNVSVQLNQTAASSLNSAQQDAIKDGDLVFNISATSGSQSITAFDGTLTVTVPYDGPLPAGVWYLNSAGELEKLDCVYNPAAKTVSFTLTHLSLYVVGQDESMPTWVNPFADVKESDWFYDAVKYAHQNGLFSGTGESTFSPGAPMTRAMMVTVLYRVEGEPEVEGIYAQHMMDVEQPSWYEDAMGWAVENNIISGYGEGFYGPNDNITREQMAVMLCNYLKYKGYAIPAGTADAFADEGKISTWALEAVQAIQAMGIVSGKPGNLFDPQATATRAEVATVFANLIKYLAK